MAFNYISAAEAASLIKHGYNIGLSGFTPAGTAKAVTAELAKIAEAEHAKGNPFQIGIFTGASTGDSCDGILSRAKADVVAMFNQARSFCCRNVIECHNINSYFFV